MTDERLKALAKQFGTPAFVFDQDAFAQRIHSVRAIFPQGVRLCYSIKANPFLITAAKAHVDALEVCSPGELTICEQTQVSPAQIIFSGVNKTIDDIRRAAADKVGVFTAESALQLQKIDAVGRERGAVLPVLLRLESGSQFGMDEAVLRSIVQNRAEYAGVCIKGIHFFTGTMRRKTQELAGELAMLTELMDALYQEYGYRAEKLEFGPGLFTPYFTSEDFSDTLAPAKALAPLLESLAQKVELTVEMGRFFAAECGYYLTKVEDVKCNRGTQYAIVDGGVNHVNYYGQTMGMKVPIIRHFPAEENAQTPCNKSEAQGKDGEVNDAWTLCGSLCTTADVLVRRAAFTGLCVGDMLAFCNIGAYSVTEGLALFLSRSLPRVLLYSGKGTVQARDFVQTSSFNTIMKP